MYEQYMGVIKALGFQFTPDEWGWCSGALMDINQFSALFSLLGCRFGGDCRVSFALPDLRGRVPMGYETGPGLTPRFMGQMPGLFHEVLNHSHMASHTHSHTYAAGAGTASSVHVAKQGGKNTLPTTGDYIAAPASSLGATDGNMYLAPSDVTDTATIGGVSSTSDGFVNQLFTIHPTPNPTEYVEIEQPSLGVNYQICIEGLYPARS